LKADPRFSTLVEILTAAGFTDDASVIGPITLFAPTNDAFAGVDPATLEAIKNDPERVSSVLSFHIVESALTIEFLGTLTSVPTVHGEPLTVSVENGIVKVNGIATIAPELKGSNGVVIPIDGVLQPATPT
jgi:uncharacterized surface protein with fasciclin (FAS1) repeats